MEGATGAMSFAIIIPFLPDQVRAFSPLLPASRLKCTKCRVRVFFFFFFITLKPSIA